MHKLLSFGLVLFLVGCNTQSQPVVEPPTVQKVYNTPRKIVKPIPKKEESRETQIQPDVIIPKTDCQKVIIVLGVLSKQEKC